MSKNKKDPNCTCVKGRMGSYVNCPVHNPYKNKHFKSTDMTDNQEQKLDVTKCFRCGEEKVNTRLALCEKCKSELEQLAAHKTRQPVINEINIGSYKIRFMVSDAEPYFGASEEEIADRKKWRDAIVVIKAYCEEQGITPEVLIEQAKAFKSANPLSQAWVFEVLAYCSDLGISPDELIEQHKHYNKVTNNLFDEALKKEFGE